MAYDLSTYEGRQQARDAGNWVGADSSGNITMEAGHPGGQANVTSSGGGGGGGGGTPTSSTSGGGQSYQTVNGPKTLDQINAELKEAGWGGDGDPIAVYARTTGGPVSVGGAAAAPAAADASTPPKADVQYTNLDQYNKDVANAQAAANQAYLRAKLNLDTEELAFRKAQQAFSETLSRAQLTGTYEGQQTQAAQKQAADIAAQQAGLSGVFQGAPTLAAQSQYFNQALAQQTQQQKVVQDYLTLLSTLRGPQDYGQYLRTMASSPEGLRGLVNAAAGAQGRVPSFGVTGVQPQAVTLPGFMGAAGAGGVAPGQAGTSYADYQAAAQNLPPPSQIAPQNWNAMGDSQKNLLLSMYEAAGWNINDVQSQYAASLPKFGTNTPATGSFRLV